ncbi:MAG: TonB-dependent receptor domain-containing protein [Bacteroidota bacterium]
MRPYLSFRAFLTLLLTVSTWTALSAQEVVGRIQGTLKDTVGNLIPGATVKLFQSKDSVPIRKGQTNASGEFDYSGLLMGTYRLIITAAEYRPLLIDSIGLGSNRYVYSFEELIIRPGSSTNMKPVVIVVDRSLIQSKDGNITFLAGDSPLAAGANASELMTQVPLVNKDPDGKLTVRGKEPKILIDDKPVELNMQQLQELLESMPGSSIEKIEVMTNPPPQFAQESAVINIVTRKGRVGKTGRLALSAGTRGEWSANGQFTYRKDHFSMQFNVGFSQNRFAGDGYSNRQNIYTDSTNQFNTLTDYVNRSKRPSARLSLDHDWKKVHAINVVWQYNDNQFDNSNATYFSNLNRFGDRWRYSRRGIDASGANRSLSQTATYTWRPKAGETLRVIGQVSGSDNWNIRRFEQNFLLNDGTTNGLDSIQYQDNFTRVLGWNVRINYDRMLVPKKTYLSTGVFFSQSLNWVDVLAQYLKKPEWQLVDLPALGQDFNFRQNIQQYRLSVKQLFTERFSLLAGLVYEHTLIRFDLQKEGLVRQNQYENWLPFTTLNRSWKDRYNLTLSYRQTIRRPGLGEMNPTVDFSDPYNTRFGNPDLQASTAHNFDLVAGWNRSGKFLNVGMGYNLVRNVFSQVRSLKEGGGTEITWENISDRNEWEASMWTGWTFFKRLKMNSSFSYTYNLYGEYDRFVRGFRNGGSFTSTIGSSYTPNDKASFTGQFNLNRFATPQGYARWNMSLNLGTQWKFLRKRMTVSLNAIDPIMDQQRYTYTYAPNFSLKSFSRTRTRNYRLSVAWLIQPKPNPPIKLSH